MDRNDNYKISEMYDVNEMRRTIVEYFPGKLNIYDSEGTVIFAQNMDGLAPEDWVGMNLWENAETKYYNAYPSLKAFTTKKQTIDFVGPGEYRYVTCSVPVIGETGDVENVITYSFSDEYINDIVKALDTELDRATQSLRIISELHTSQNEIITKNKDMLSLIRRVQQAAGTPATILLFGETGTGKDIFAHYIYSVSNRNNASFFPLNCAALPDSIIESELFGYEKGTFTGALAKGKKGIFELSNEGTIFLDEIGELPLSIQAKLLRVLETGEFTRVGGHKVLKTDIRVISATNRNLEDLVRQGKFREDLFYRLNIISFDIPPLRERADDIPLLAEYFLKELNRRYGSDKKMTQELLHQMMKYSWPGNVRELKNFMERIFVFADNGYLHPVSDEIAADSGNKAEEAGKDDGGLTTILPLKTYLREQERKYLTEVMTLCDWNIRRAAELLNITRSNLYQKLSFHKLGFYEEGRT